MISGDTLIHLKDGGSIRISCLALSDFKVQPGTSLEPKETNRFIAANSIDSVRVVRWLYLGQASYDLYTLDFASSTSITCGKKQRFLVVNKETGEIMLISAWALNNLYNKVNDFNTKLAFCFMQDAVSYTQLERTKHFNDFGPRVDYVARLIKNRQATMSYNGLDQLLPFQDQPGTDIAWFINDDEQYVCLGDSKKILACLYDGSMVYWSFDAYYKGAYTDILRVLKRISMRTYQLLTYVLRDRSYFHNNLLNLACYPSKEARDPHLYTVLLDTQDADLFNHGAVPYMNANTDLCPNLYKANCVSLEGFATDQD